MALADAVLYKPSFIRQIGLVLTNKFKGKFSVFCLAHCLLATRWLVRNF